jgi:hypothetical protein
MGRTDARPMRQLVPERLGPALRIDAIVSRARLYSYHTRRKDPLSLQPARAPPHLTYNTGERVSATPTCES